jgi:hypothetical protein
MTQHVEATPVYYHDCPALGPQTKIIRATLADSKGEVILGYQHKCPFCLQTAGEWEPAPGVTILPEGGYSVDMSKAIRMEPAS